MNLSDQCQCEGDPVLEEDCECPSTDYSCLVRQITDCTSAWVALMDSTSPTILATYNLSSFTLLIFCWFQSLTLFNWLLQAYVMISIIFIWYWKFLNFFLASYFSPLDLESSKSKTINSSGKHYVVINPSGKHYVVINPSGKHRTHHEDVLSLSHHVTQPTVWRCTPFSFTVNTLNASK